MNNKVKVAIIGTQGIPARYGGFETLAENLVKNKTDVIHYTIFCSAKLYSEKQKNYHGANLVYINVNANGVSSIFYDLICMFLSLNSDVMLILGVSGSLFLPFIRLIYRGRIITNVDGIEWKRDKWNKPARFILHISEKFAVRFSNIVIADNYGIVEYITKTYKREAIMIEYGADHVLCKKQMNQYEYEFYNKQYTISVCRIEPENNIHLILEAFSRKIDMSLVIVGNWKNSAYGLTLYKKYCNFAHIHLLDPIYDSEKINYLRLKSFIYIHGHSAGGTNPSLVEAMYLGLPIFAFDCIYNRYTTENQCIYWSNIDELYRHIIQYEKKELDIIGKTMKSIADKRYRWDIIVLKYETLFNNENVNV